MASYTAPLAADEVTLTAASGTLAIKTGGVLNAHVGAAAAIALSKLASTPITIHGKFTRVGIAGRVMSSDGTQRYMAVFGPMNDTGGQSLPNTQPPANHYLPAAITVSTLKVYVVANSGTGTTLKLQKNGADTAMTATLGSGATGVLTFAGGPIAFAVGDQIAISVQAGGGGQVDYGGIYLEWT